MQGLSLATKGDGPLFGMWLSHATNTFKGSTIYDRSAQTTAFRQSEANLGQQGWLNAEGRASALRTAHNLANPPAVDATLTFSGSVQNGTVTVACKNGTEKTFQVRLAALDDKSVAQAFHHVDAAVIRCKASPKIA